VAEERKHTFNLTYVFFDVCFAMKANPGGQIDLRSVIGRDRLIEILWDAVDLQSLILTAERRIGKTTVIKKLKAEPRQGWTPVYQDLERCHSAMDFAMAVYREVHQFLSNKKKAARRVKEFLQALGGTEIGGLFKLPEKAGAPWKEVLTHAVEDLIHENEAGDTRLLFLWDEMPYMLANIRDREGEPIAMEVLDLLRALRQTHGALRMVITGSIGLHHVITSLKDKKYGNAPVNDMASIEVNPLDEPDALHLATLLISGEGLLCPDVDATAGSIAAEADCFPFYIHHIARALKIRGLTASPETVASVVESQLIDANDPWELRHYRERIPVYYGEDEGAVCHLLDELACRGAAASANDLLAHLKAVSSFDDRERLLRLLSLMEQDHYLTRDINGAYDFRFPLIRRWWKINRAL
jgi:hypothetical protein